VGLVRYRSRREGVPSEQTAGKWRAVLRLRCTNFVFVRTVRLQYSRTPVIIINVS
jgi:hypothetical protein